MKRIFLLLLGTVFLYGCNQNPTSTDESIPTDTQQLSELTQNEENDYFALDQMSEGRTYSDELDSSITPIRWGRFIRDIRSTRDITFDSSNRDTARVRVIWVVAGDFRIVTGSDTINKPFTDRFERDAVFVRTGRMTRYRHLNWRLVRVSAVEGRTQNQSDVDITTVNWYKKSPLDHDWSLIRTITDPLTTWQLRDTLPVYRSNDSIKVEVVMNGTGPYFGQIHFKSRGLPHHHRRTMLNSGPSQFVAAGKIPSDATNLVRQLYVDVMTDGTIHDSQAPYSANLWGMLYRVN